MRIAHFRKFLTALAFLIFAPSVMALEQVTLNFWEEAACPNENIYMEGSVRFQFHAVLTEGHTTSFFNAYWTGNAWGMDSGDEYILRGKWMEVVQNMPEDMPYMFLWNDHFQLIGKGKAPNYDFYNKVKILVNANGELVIDLDESETPCPTVDFGYE